jgi:hypothetical protein
VDGVIRLSRAKEPIVEFEEGNVRKIFIVQFANLFFLGQGLEKVKVDLSPRMKLHLMRYYDNRFSNCPQFMFLMGDMTERHEVARNGVGKLMHSKTTMDLIKSNFLDGSIVQRLDDAERNPNSPDAKQLIKMLEQVIKVMSSNIEFTPAARSSVLQNIYGHVFRFGIPNYFITISPDDSYDLDAIRRALVDKRASFDPEGFDDKNGEAVRACLLLGGEGRFDPARLISHNGVAAAMSFENKKQMRAKFLYGIDLNARKTVVYEDKIAGIFGIMRDIYSVLETQARQALHEHALGFTNAIPPHILEMIAEYPELVKLAVQVLDSIVKAEISIKAAENRILRRVNDRSVDNTFADVKKIIRPSLLFGCGPLGKNETHEDKIHCHEDFIMHVEDTVGYVGYHDEHSFTCHKEPNGRKSCRVGYSKKENNGGTRPLIIKTVEKVIVLPNGEEITIETVEEIDFDGMLMQPCTRLPYSQVGANPLQPFPEPDKRMLVWSLSRRSFCKLDESDLHCNLGKIPYDRRILTNPNFNGPVVSYNDVLTATQGCNTAIYPLGSEEEAKVSIFYQSKYVVKDVIPHKKLISIALTAHRVTTDHPNIHVSNDNSDAAIKSSGIDAMDLESIPNSISSVEVPNINLLAAKRFGNVLLNSLRGTAERSLQETASKELNYPASYSSNNNWLLYISDAILDVKEIYSDIILSTREIDLNNQSNCDSDHGNEMDTDEIQEQQHTGIFNNNLYHIRYFYL